MIETVSFHPARLTRDDVAEVERLDHPERLQPHAPVAMSWLQKVVCAESQRRLEHDANAIEPAMPRMNFRSWSDSDLTAAVLTFAAILQPGPEDDRSGAALRDLVYRALFAITNEIDRRLKARQR